MINKKVFRRKKKQAKIGCENKLKTSDNRGSTEKQFDNRKLQ